MRADYLMDVSGEPQPVDGSTDFGVLRSAKAVRFTLISGLTGEDGEAVIDEDGEAVIE